MVDLEHTLRCCVYALVADLITADHKIQNAEVGVAGNLCEQYFPDLASRLVLPDDCPLKLSDIPTRFLSGKRTFDIREFCLRAENYPETSTVIGILLAILDSEGKTLILDLLQEVAKADSKIAKQEAALFSMVARE